MLFRGLEADCKWVIVMGLGSGSNAIKRTGTVTEEALGFAARRAALFEEDLQGHLREMGAVLSEARGLDVQALLQEVGASGQGSYSSRVACGLTVTFRSNP